MRSVGGREREIHSDGGGYAKEESYERVNRSRMSKDEQKLVSAFAFEVNW